MAEDQTTMQNPLNQGPKPSFDTPMQPSQGQPPEKLHEFGGSTSMKRPGQPVDVAPAYVFFASQESSYITGELLGVTGGNHLA